MAVEFGAIKLDLQAVKMEIIYYCIIYYYAIIYYYIVKYMSTITEYGYTTPKRECEQTRWLSGHLCELEC